MSHNPSTPWHKASYDKFLHDDLPQLLADRLPLAGYQVTEASPHAVSLQVALSGGIQTIFSSIPCPDDDGIFTLGSEPRLVVPTASHASLDTAEIACVGEQLLAYIKEQLGQASNGISWSEEVLRAWLPLDRWVDEFLQTKAQRLDTTNWLSRHTHPRRIVIAGHLGSSHDAIAPGQLGRVCPYETPESSNMGRVFTIATGAEIRGGKIVVVDECPEATLGLSASMLPFIEHNDPNRLLMAANFQRQSLPNPSCEPALVQTGLEPAGAPDFWCGYNLLTAFVSLGETTTEDGIVISASAARRITSPAPVEPGDRFSNRHGIKGVISQILPDNEMPHLPDGTPVELVYSFSGIPVRAVFGPPLEAAWGLVAHVEGQAVIVPPFGGPSAPELNARLKAAGLPEDGQFKLSRGAGGPVCEQPSTVGWVYWNRMVQRAGDNLAASTRENIGLAMGELEFQALKTAEALENIHEAFITRSARRAGAGSLADALSSGPVGQLSGPTPWFSELARRLQVAGIQAEIRNGELAFRFAPPVGESLKLARPMPHPWLHETLIEAVGASEGATYASLVEANERLARMLASHAPAKLLQTASDSLAAQLEKFFKELLPAEMMSMGSQISWPDEPGYGEPQLFSAKAIVAPGPGLEFDQVGLPDEIAWTLFAPLVSRKLRLKNMSFEHTDATAHALDEVLASAWVIVHRAAAITPTNLLAFRPVRVSGLDRVIRLPALACGPLNADFDGDQLAVYLPVTEAAQQEAGEKMTLAAHLKRDPALVKTMLSHADLLWGLAWMGLKPEGRTAIAAQLGVDPASLPDLFTQETLHRLAGELLTRTGAKETLARLQALARLGYQAAHDAGASLSPFFASHLRLPPIPENDDPDRWLSYREEAAEAILAGTDFTDPTFGPQLLSAKTRERTRLRLQWVVGPRCLTMDADDRMVVIRHTQVEGLTPKEAFACVAGARRAFADLLLKIDVPPAAPSGWNVLARARRLKYPGIVFARAAASGEVDPLEDIDSRLRVGVI